MDNSLSSWVEGNVVFVGRVEGMTTLTRGYNIDRLMPRPNEGTSLNPQEVMESIIKLIEDTTDPDSWRDAGGLNGTIRDVDNVLIVRQTQANQRRVEQVLRQLLGCWPPYEKAWPQPNYPNLFGR
jgi:hypothetical protein